MGSAAYTNFIHPESSTPAFDNLRADPSQGTALLAFLRATEEESKSTSPSRLVRAVQTARRRRDAILDPDLFADPAWDMLLELYATRLEQQRITISNLCLAAIVPPTTALRWITRLENDGLAQREQDHSDARRYWIALTPKGSDAMQRYFETLPSGSLSV